MSTLACLGFGYCATHYVAEFGARFDRIVGTVTNVGKAGRLAAGTIAGREVEALVFDGSRASSELLAALAAADAVLVSIPPADDGDPALAAWGGARSAGKAASIVYLSTIGVYGDHAGGWVDETTPASPLSTRSATRLAAENAWRALGARSGRPVAILRLAGIYGPGQNALRQVASGTARRVVKPGQVFNRIHVADIAQAIESAIARRADGVFNVSDDAPAPNADVIAFAATLLGAPLPPELPFAEAAGGMSPLARSFYAESKRASNARMKQELGVKLRYPTFREGLRALFAAGDHLKG
ncbi:MAG TPA: NAD-dependent epimerase/dehydratase family protein [Xanthobacteraceae bacterium]|nr:NAD-dependent epimerase/dehydratase family protein [Xanthobacteraceae bacterium]